MKAMYLDGVDIIIDTPFNPDEVSALKSGIKSARWDKIKKVWRVPVADMPLAINFAKSWEIDISEEIENFELPSNQFAESKITQSGDKLLINIPYDPVVIDVLKNVTGIVWDARTKMWVAPFSSANEVIIWAHKFDINVPEHIQEQLRIEKQHEDYSISLSKAHDAHIAVPNMKMELFPYQRAGVRYATEKGRTFIADEMGLGKSLQAIATVQYTNKYPALVVAPSSLLIDWETKIMEGVEDRSVQIITGRKDTPDLTADFVIIGYPNLSHHKTALAKHNFQSFVLDESHYCKNKDAARTKAARYIASKIPADGNVLLLTGTPITNKPAEYAPQLQIIDQIDKFGGLWAFYTRYCGAFRDKWGHWHIDGANHLEELQSILRQHCYVRREKEDVLTDLPPIMYSTVTTEMPNKFKSEYNKAVYDLVEWYANQKEQLAIKEGKNPTAARIKAHFATQGFEEIIQMTALRVITARAKIEPAIEWVTNANDQGEKVVIVAHHREIVQTLSAALGGLMIIGGQKPEVTEADKRKFMNDPDAMNIVISATAAAHGHTLTAASNMLMVEPPWTPATYRQAAARIHRIGQTKTATIHNLVIPGTIDTHVYARLQEKIRNTDPAVSDNPELVELINVMMS